MKGQKEPIRSVNARKTKTVNNNMQDYDMRLNGSILCRCRFIFLQSFNRFGQFDNDGAHGIDTIGIFRF